MSPNIRTITAQSDSYMDRIIERLLEEIVPMLQDPEAPFSYRIHQLGDGDTVNFEHYLCQDAKETPTHEEGKLFDVGLMFFEELLYTYGVDGWETIEFFFKTTDEDDLIWNLHIDGEQVRLA